MKSLAGNCDCGAGTILDFEVQSQFDVTVNVTDSLLGAGVQDSAHFSLLVTDVNESPEVAGPSSINIQEDAGPQFFDLGTWFTDVDAADTSLTLSIQSLTASWLHSSIDTHTNQLRIQVDPNQSGTAELVIRATDHDGLFVEKVMEINVSSVNDTVTVSKKSYTSPAGSTVNGSLLSSTVDVDGETLEVVITDPPENGTLNVDANGDFTFTPDEDFAGTTSFRFHVNDGVQPSDEAIVEIVITPVIDASPPVDSSLPIAPPPKTVDEGEAKTLDESNSDELSKSQTELPEVSFAQQKQDEESSTASTKNSVVSESAIEIVDQFSTIDQLNSSARGESDESPAARRLRLGGGVDLNLHIGGYTVDIHSPYSFAHSVSEALSQSGLLWSELDVFQQQTAQKTSMGTLAIGSVGTMTSGLLVGYVIWVARSGLLLSSLAATMPAWNLLDPLAIVAVADGGGGDGESLEDIVENQKKKIDTA